MNMRHGLRFLSAITLAALLSACASPVLNPVTGRTELSVMDEAAEIKEGAKAHEGVLQEYGVYANPRLQAYVNEVGQKLAAQSHRANLKWTFTVLDSPEINAFALPGGYVYVTRGIMAYLESEAELAGVMGHEIGHVTARHGAQRATREQAAGIGVLAASVLGAVLEAGGIGGAGNLAGQLSQTAAAGYIASYSRDQESQADQLGAEYLSRNRYDPQNMIDVIQVLKRQEQFAADMAKAEGKPAPSGASWLASHPANVQGPLRVQFHASGYNISHAAPRLPDTGRCRLTLERKGQPPHVLDFRNGHAEVWLQPPPGDLALRLELADNEAVIASALPARVQVSGPPPASGAVLPVSTPLVR